MDRRGLLSTVGALALAGLMGVGATAADKAKTTKAACPCCGDACSCLACTCDSTKADAALGCDCCDGAACCPSTAKAADTKVTDKACCPKDTKTAKFAKASKAACSCCGANCICPACSCGATDKAGMAKTGKGCDCCGGDACCNSSTKAKVAVVR